MATTLSKAYCRAYQGAFRALVLLLDWSEPKLLRGENSVLRLAEAITAEGLKKILIVTDPGIFKLGLINPMCEGLKEKGIEYEIYAETQPNPSIDNIEAARELYVKTNCQGVIAFGGGSAMDCGKVAAARVANPNISVRQMKGQLKLRHKLPPFFAVPTTAGTGSETTVAAVVTDMSTHEKYAINDPKLRPGYAVLDPVLTVGLPPHITSTTGMDALTHAVEAYIGHSNTKSTAFNAEKAVKLIFENIETVYSDGKNLIARDKMLYASYLAGLAFTRAYVGYAHAIAHTLGGMYSTPHGLANAIILPYVLEYFGDSVNAPLSRLAGFAGLNVEGKTEEQRAKMFIEAVKEKNNKLNIPKHIEAIKDEDIPTIVERVLKEGNPLYPVPKIMDEADCAAVVRLISGR